MEALYIVKSRNWVKLFLSTLAIGGITTGIIGFALKWSEYQSLFTQFKIIEILSILLWLVGVGFIFSIISQAGFFAYLTVHRFGLMLFRSIWNKVQIVIILFVLFDLVYFPYQLFDKSPDSIMSLIAIAALLAVVSGVIAYIKMKQTNKGAFVPAMFFMTVITTLEWTPALRTDEYGWIFLMLFPLLVCNAYQLLILPKLSEKKNGKAAEA